MPIIIDNQLPAKHNLELENIFVMSDSRAYTQDIRPLKILIVNLMPKKIETETQILRLLSNSPLQIDVELLQMTSHKSKNTPSEHIHKFYKNIDQIKDEKFDGMIVTGAPVETLEYEDVDYFEELCKVFDWSKTHVYSNLFICWAAQAALYRKYNINKYPLSKKLFGVFEQHTKNPFHALTRNLDDVFYMPHSRYTQIKADDIEREEDLEILAGSDLSGASIIADKACRNFYILGHLEYDRITLANEYFRDKNKGLKTALPYNYFPNDNTEKTPPLIWRQSASVIFSNWLNYFVYQKTPYDINKIK